MDQGKGEQGTHHRDYEIYEKVENRVPSAN
jgi:hypothetical protein